MRVPSLCVVCPWAVERIEKIYVATCEAYYYRPPNEYHGLSISLIPRARRVCNNICYRCGCGARRYRVSVKHLARLSETTCAAQRAGNIAHCFVKMYFFHMLSSTKISC